MGATLRAKVVRRGGMGAAERAEGCYPRFGAGRGADSRVSGWPGRGARRPGARGRRIPARPSPGGCGPGRSASAQEVRLFQIFRMI